MLIGRAPVRISFGGGGTDLEAYYAKFGGVVVSAAINKYIYGIVTKNFDKNFQMISADYQSVFSKPHDSAGDHEDNGDLNLATAVVEHFNLDAPFNIFVASEVPPGTGLGSSGAAAVNLINVCAALAERPMTKQEVAELAYHIEVIRLGAPVGKQDQYASAFGGINCIRFEKEGVTVEPLKLSRQTIKALERRLLLFFTGNSRQAREILQRQKESTYNAEEPVIESLHRIKDLALEVKAALESGQLTHFGDLLHQSWQYKKMLAPNISNSSIDEAYLLARENGASGGKITGAGGGGFLMLYCETEHQTQVRRVLEERGLHEMHFAFDFQGSRVLLNTGMLDPALVWDDDQ
jgi:D-glycero-alpha-D-manno-heptose-7-phosphate kinase